MSNNLDIKNLVEFNDGMKVYVDGPLANLFTDSLNAEYKKEINKETGMALETQVIQMLQQAEAFSKININSQAAKINDLGMLYVVDSKDIIAKDLISITKSASVMTNNQLRNSTVILMNKDDAYDSLEVGLESLCNGFNINVKYGIEDFMNSVKNSIKTKESQCT